MGTRVARYRRPMTQPLVTLYTSSYCGYCRAAKGLLQRRNIAFQEIDLTGDDAGREALDALDVDQSLMRAMRHSAPAMIKSTRCYQKFLSESSWWQYSRIQLI